MIYSKLLHVNLNSNFDLQCANKMYLQQISNKSFDISRVVITKHVHVFYILKSIIFFINHIRMVFEYTQYVTRI